MVCMVLWFVTPWMSYILSNFSFCLYVERVHMYEYVHLSTSIQMARRSIL